METIQRKSAVDLLREVYQTRRERNQAYSMNSFARDLGTSLSLLSRIFSGARPVTVKFAMQVAAALDLNETDSKSLIFSVVQSSSKNAKISKKIREKFEREENDSPLLYTTLEIERFKAMASWYHLAILSLTALTHFQNDSQWIAKQLGISSIEAQEAIERLIALGLLVESGEDLRRSEKNLYVKTQKSEVAVRKSHEQMINKATEELKSTTDDSFQKRLINGITFPCGPEHIEVIKDKIDQFENEILAMSSSGIKTSVYQMNIQFFPLTKSKEP